MFGKLAAWVLAHRVPVALLAVVIVIAGLAGATQLKIDFSFKAIIGGDDPSYVELEHFLTHWSGDEKTTLVVASTTDGDLLTAERLSLLDELTDTLRDLSFVEQTAGPTTYPVNLGKVAGLVDTTSLIDAAPAASASPAVWDAWKAEVLQTKGLVPLMLSKDARYAAIVVPMDINADDLLSFAPALAEIRAVLERYDQKSGITLTTAGIPAARADIITLMQHDMLLFSAISFGAMALLLLLMFRSKHGLFIPLITAVIPTILLFGLMGWLGEPVGLVSQVYPVLIPAIAVADTIHVLARFHDEARALLKAGAQWNDDTRSQAIVSAMRHVGMACLFTSITTMIGFLSLFAADMRVLHDFGLFAAFGIAAAFVTMVVVAPLLMTRVKTVPELRESASGAPASEAWLSGIARSTARHPRIYLMGSAVLVAVALAVASQLTIDSRLADALPPDHPSNQASDQVDEHLGGVITVHVDISAEPGSLTDPQLLNAMDRVERWVDQNPEFPAVQGPAAIVRALNRSLGGPDEIPTEAGVVSELFFLLEDGDGLRQLFDNDAGRARIIVSNKDLGAKTILPRIDILKEEVRAAFDGTGATVGVTSVPYVAYRGFARVAEELLTSLLTAFLFIALAIGILFRSIRICLISLVPNIVPLLLTLAALILSGRNLEMNSSIIFTVALALAVDNTIHILARLYEERRYADTSHEIMLGALLHTGRALTISAAILVGAFGLNLFSSFPSLQIFGLLGGVAITTALACNFFMLPPLMHLFGGMGAQRTQGS